MHPSHIIAESHNIDIVGDKHCCICGAPAEKNKKQYIKKTFTNHDALCFPQSDYICNACAFCLSPLTRRTSFLATEQEFIPIKREQLFEHLFTPPNIPFVFCITTSFKKYLWLYAAVNTNPNEYQIQLDEMGVICRPNIHRKIFDAVEELYQYCSKTEIASGDYRFINIQKMGIDTWRILEQQIKQYRGSGIFKLLLHCANRKEENKWKKSQESSKQLNLF